MDHETEVDFRETYMFLGKNIKINWVDLYRDTISATTHITQTWTDWDVQGWCAVPRCDQDGGRAFIGDGWGIFEAKAGVYYYGPPR